MSAVAVEPTQGSSCRAETRGSGRTVRVLEDSVPETKVSAARHSVVLDDVVRVDNPETARLNVGVEETVGLPGEDSQVVLHNIVLLHSVLNEERQALHVVGNIMLHHQVVHSVDGAGSVEASVHGVPSDVGAGGVTVDVEMDWISADSESLTNKGEL